MYVDFSTVLCVLFGEQLDRWDVKKNKKTIILNKPVGFVSHADDEGKYKSSLSLILKENFFGDEKLDKLSFKLAPAGRLDIDSTGLLVLTEDGVIAKKIIQEDSEIEKEYLVRVNGNLIPNGLKLLNHGLSLDNKPLKKAIVSWINEDQLKFILKEGKKRQIRRMCEILGYRVTKLKRTRIMNIHLDINIGEYRDLSEDEVKQLFNQ